MRDAINSNPLVQAAVIGVLLLGGVFFFISSSGGGEESSAGGETEATVSVAGTTASGTATGSTPGEAVEGAVEAAEGSLGQPVSAAPLSLSQAASAAPPLPRPVLRAWRANQTLVLLFVRGGGIDDDLAKRATLAVAGFGGVAPFVVPAHRISRYAAITEGVGVDRVPALVVVTPRHLDSSVPTASVSYGFQSAASVRQAVIDAGYEGPTVDYHP